MTLQINTTTGQRALTPDEQTEVREGIGAQSAAQVTAAASSAAATAASAAVAAHASAADPHPGQYATAAHTHALLMTQPERDKLAGIAPAATANATDAALRDRATHTGTQPIASVDGLQATLDGKASSAHTHTAAQISDATAAGRGLLTAADAAAQRTALVLGNVNNTADADKPVSAAQAAAIAAATTADAIADTLEAAATGAPADLARIQASVSGEPARSATLLLVGDSRMQQHWSDAAGTIVGTNPLVIQLTNHRLSTGDFVSLNFMTPDAANGLWAVTRISANQFSVPYTGSATGTPSVYYKHSPSPRGIYTWASAKLGERGFSQVVNTAIGGMRSDQILTLLPAMLDRAGPAAYGAVAATMCGVNDRAQFPTRTVDEVLANLIGIWDILRARGCYIHAITELPLGPGHAQFSAAFVGWQARLSRKIVDYWRGRVGGIALDAFGLISDPTQIDGRARVGMHYDNIHPSPLGAERIGAYIAAAIAPGRTVTRDRVSSLIDSYTADAASSQYLTNPMLNGAAGTVSPGTGIGTVTGTAPNDFVFELQGGPSTQAVALTTTARIDGRGNTFSATVTGATAASAFRVRNSGAGNPDLRTRLAPGQKFFIEADLAWTCTALKFASVYCSITIDGAVSDMVALLSSAEAYPQDSGGLFRSEVCQIAASTPGTVTAGQFVASFAFSGAGGGTVNISSPRMVLVP